MSTAAQFNDGFHQLAGFGWHASLIMLQGRW
jgi:hypothetical protein